jgi:hypothetical protein
MLTVLFSRVGRLAISAVAAALCIAGTSGGADAQALNCGTNDLARLALETLKKKADDTSPSARNLVENWRANLPDLRKDIERMRLTPPSTWPPADLQWATLVTNIAKTILESNDLAITLFRQCRDGLDQVIKALVWAARGDETNLRINAASILANVVDNTTVCFVLHHLRDPTISASGRVNLLGVTVGMASYAYKENVDSIQQTIRRLNLSGDTTQTQRLIDELLTRIQRSPNRDTSLPDNLSMFCKNYNYDGPLN